MKTKLICLLTAIALISCKKTEVKPVYQEPKKDLLPITNYILTIIPNTSNLTGDTLILKINNVLIFRKYGTGIAEYYGGIKVKTGDRLSVYYNPGTYQDNGSTLVDFNNLHLFLDYNQVWETKCKCLLNYDKILN
jgi:hypothetical protein